ncbi:Bis(5'-nucleosyl)-tetraphosphatase, symmetrical [Cyphellophora attinorum]|uniref:Bis(5'-nucleosyl)-tetraphosphatase, symmetrical n=1 Tax=Cyphellophora attinorum TaxID=1664694 RepID=A0A0N1H4Z4_9EURO|nr:Bis(5'-nucleosyl)-tetraphosphatase, symmetrical [Phialophora attinorum]KPI36620.1 Bis(5'-nucleosyl)-tetraphosphatase, symmetrical [Phialophora attinorum]
MAKERLSNDGRAVWGEKGPRVAIIEGRNSDWSKENTAFQPPGEQILWYDRYLDRLDDAYDALLALVKAPKFRRLTAIVICATILTWSMWTKVVWPWIEEERAAWDIYNTQESGEKTQFGVNAHPHLGLIQTEELDPKYLPGGAKADKSRRLIFIGDIHGCHKELLELLIKAKYDHNRDHIISVGDIVTKGPDSSGVIDFLMEQEASVVRGNHDDKLILIAEQRHKSKREGEMEAEHKKKHKKNTHEAIAHALTKKQLKFMQSFPLILKVGQIKGIGEIVVVHAGLVPGVPLKSQDPASIMNMRSIDLRTHVPSKLHHGKHSRPWFSIWNKFQRLQKYWKNSKDRTSHQPLTVVYGHDARMGLQVSKYSKGLDSNCARGGHLTALVVDEHGKQKIVQVSCKKDYTVDSEA